MTWADIPGYEGLYQASDDGQIKTIAGRVLAIRGGNYGNVTLFKRGARITAAVHVLVASAFHGPRPSGHEVDHIDRDKWNNKASNLRWVTHLENMQNRVAPTGERHPMVKLTRQQVEYIRERRRVGIKLRVLAAELGVSKTTISDVARGLQWVG